MEIIFRTGRDKKYFQRILDLEKELETKNLELRDLKLDNGLKDIKIEKLSRSIEYYKKQKKKKK